MASSNFRESIELFHLLFLDQLGRKVVKDRCVLKGGGNLRFFYEGTRYSEDLDFDVGDLPVHHLAEKVGGIFASGPFRDILEVRGIEIEHVTEAKQTETAQRWKIGLLTDTSSLPVPTRIEFSRRGIESGATFGRISTRLIRTYELMPIMACHYGAEAAVRQKIKALVSRNFVQARDIFDLQFLLSRADIRSLRSAVDESQLAQVGERALSVGYETFRSQVFSFLPPDVQAGYDSSDVWETLVLDVVETLKSLIQ